MTFIYTYTSLLWFFVNVVYIGAIVKGVNDQNHSSCC